MISLLTDGTSVLVGALKTGGSKRAAGSCHIYLPFGLWLVNPHYLCTPCGEMLLCRDNWSNIPGNIRTCIYQQLSTEVQSVMTKMVLSVVGEASMTAGDKK